MFPTWSVYFVQHWLDFSICQWTCDARLEEGNCLEQGGVPLVQFFVESLFAESWLKVSFYLEKVIL